MDNIINFDKFELNESYITIGDNQPLVNLYTDEYSIILQFLPKPILMGTEKEKFIETIENKLNNNDKGLSFSYFKGNGAGITFKMNKNNLKEFILNEII